ncbi:MULTISPECIES: leucyl aminopeptidase [unclassified Rhodanobacter]|uniref:leucyl aminopeptidase n=1 Tax=unclassified Rhodanobacter TaxID=2621553 RepID=UPI0007A9AC78|nr:MULTISPECIES: leucyl aminopeptidase [unclassified Rhodanobacter]KZC17269.1 leucyl aminopeptidase [Rhodanobacter sp. FW104-R8]KZC29125.1 leucyl aminopeptidase [Rhodanobacter sp. FW510-T8]KZC33063.1 leucyl aminopeptidase [Rhodanobacter sp. FW510-R10]
MTLQFSLGTAAPATVDSACVLVGVYEQGVLTSAAAQLDSAAGGAIKRQVESGDISGKAGSTTVLFAPAGIAAQRVLVVGLGAQKSFDAARFQKVNIEATRALARLPVANAVSCLTEVDVPGRDGAWRVRTAALACDHAAYRYTATFKPRDKNKQPELAALTFAAGADAQGGLDQAVAIAEGVRFARELANLPPNICNPAYIAAQAQAFADAQDKVSCTVLDEAGMEKLGFGSLLAVARGSVNKPRLIALEYKGGNEGDKPYAFVGKGVTFDSGGISLKPGAGMEEMKFDMGGAAGVLGAFVAAVKMGLKLNLVCVVPAVENMPDGDSYRPSDVLTSLSGLTIEVLNTDAEGRLILCDALTWTAQTYQPQALIDAATLTGACVIALGKHASGLMSKHDDLAAELLAAGEETLDRAWRLPLWDDYQAQLDSGFADVANIGGKSAGAITAGCFLSRFTDGQRWAHLDIAGTAWEEGRKGLATGRPVALLAQWLMDRSEK